MHTYVVSSELKKLHYTLICKRGVANSMTVCTDVPYSSKFSRSKTSVIQPAQLLTDNITAQIDTPIGLKNFVDKIFVINLHLTKITKIIDLKNLTVF